jgi:hypothetical protein
MDSESDPPFQIVLPTSQSDEDSKQMSDYLESIGYRRTMPQVRKRSDEVVVQPLHPHISSR